MSKNTIPSELFLPYLQQMPELPRYRALFRAFQQAILQGKLHSGAKLPASRPLSIALKLSRNTVKTAYDMLLAEGYIETRHGSGSYVSEIIPEQHSPQDNSCELAQGYPSPPRLSVMAQRLSTPSHIGPAHVDRRLLSLGPDTLHGFPWAQWQRHLNKAATQIKHLPSDSVMGNEWLRNQIAHYLQITRGVKCSQQNIMICSGSQQAMYLSLQLLLNPNESILIEEPGYQGISRTIDALGAIKVPVPVDDSGFNLQQGLALAPDARLISLTPSRNYPMGYTLSLERRLALLDWAKRQQAWIIEDDYDSDFRFDGAPLTSLQGLGGEHCVIYAGTFSRILHPSIRLGYVVIPEALIDAFCQLKQCVDGGLSQLPQLTLAEFMAAGHFSSHVRRMRKCYQQRRACLHDAMDQAFAGQLMRVQSDGGMHSVFLLAEGESDTDLCYSLEQQGLGVRALSTYYSGEQSLQGLVIGYAAHTEKEIQRGVNVIQQVYQGR